MEIFSVYVYSTTTYSVYCKLLFCVPLLAIRVTEQTLSNIIMML